jgi:hypothetical protein
MSRTRTIFASLLFFAALFTVIAALQYLFIRHQIEQTVGGRLEYWARDLRTTLDRNDILDLAALRRAAPKASAFMILGSDGTVIAMHGFVRGSISYAALPAGSTYDKPVVVKSSLGEEWHLLARKLKGGALVVGASSTDCPPDINARLVETAKGFGSSFESAMFPSLRDKDANVDFALLTDDGILWEDNGGIPLRAKKMGLWFKGEGPIVTVAGTPFFIRKVPIMDRAKHQIGSIIVMKDVALEQEMLRDSLVFNVAVAIVSVLLCGLVLFVDLRKGARSQT